MSGPRERWTFAAEPGDKREVGPCQNAVEFRFNN